MIEVPHVCVEETVELFFMKDEEVIQAFSPHASQKAFADGLCSWSSVRRSKTEQQVFPHARCRSVVIFATEFVGLRQTGLAVLERVTPQDFNCTVEHCELGTVTLGQLLHEWAAHDLNHTIQAERAVMQPFIQGYGPRRSYFRDHEVANR